MSKQEKRAKTLLEYMGFKDPDIKSNDHDDWCLRLLNDEVIKTFFHNKMVEDVYQTDILFLKISQDGNVNYYKQRYDYEWNNTTSIFECGCIVDWNYNFSLNGGINYENCVHCKRHPLLKYKNSHYGDHGYKLFEKFEKELTPHFNIIQNNIKICKQYHTPRLDKYITKDGLLAENTKITTNLESKAFDFPYVTNISKQLEYVLSNTTNNFRFGFLDVSAWITFNMITNLIVDNKIITNFQSKNENKSIVFFEVKINTPTLGEITREIEYYKDVIYSIYHNRRIQPIVIASRKYQLPEQFDSVTFDEFNTLFPRKNQLDFKEK